MSRNLITGGMGYLGSRLARELVRRGDEVVLFDKGGDPEVIGDIKDKAKIVYGDLSNWSQVLDAVKKSVPNCIYHLGALLGDACEESPSAAYMVNANGTFHVLEAARLFDVGTVVFASSMATFGMGLASSVSDDAAQKPSTVYGVIKCFCERLGEYYHHRFGLNFRGIRFPSLIGLGRRGGFTEYQMLMVEEPAHGRPFIINVDEGTQIPCLYIKDAVHSLIILRGTDESRLTRRVYNLQGFSPTAREMTDRVREYLPEAQIEFRPREEAMRVINSWPRELDCANAHRDWGWRPAYDLDRALEDFLAEATSS
jgi:threonine 3-dehydrogenase